MVALAVDVLQRAVGLRKGLIASSCVQVKSDVYEVDDLFVGFDGDA